MATLATVAERAIVRVVTAMARKTRARQPGDLLARRRGLKMAALARDLAMRPLELVVAALVVVEVPQLPVARAVAGLAAFTEFELVLVVLLVAGETFALRVLVPAGLVTLLAFDGDVAPGQRKFGASMVERRGLPVAIDVTLIAALALLALVLVVLFVAAITIGRRLAVTLLVLVACLALDLGRAVAAAQFELGAIVIELARLPVALS